FFASVRTWVLQALLRARDASGSRRRFGFPGRRQRRCRAEGVSLRKGLRRRGDAETRSEGQTGEPEKGRRGDAEGERRGEERRGEAGRGHAAPIAPPPRLRVSPPRVSVSPRRPFAPSPLRIISSSPIAERRAGAFEIVRPARPRHDAQAPCKRLDRARSPESTPAQNPCPSGERPAYSGLPTMDPG